MKRSEILETARDYITKDRAATHGDAENNFQAIADFWTVYLKGRKIGSLCPLSAGDVAIMLSLFKIARIKSNKDHIDSYIDGAGYLALGGEIETEKSR